MTIEAVYNKQYYRESKTMTIGRRDEEEIKSKLIGIKYYLFWGNKSGLELSS